MINTQTLIYKTKEELIEILQNCVECIDSDDEDMVYLALEDMEQVVYVLRNCEYKGRKQDENN